MKRPEVSVAKRMLVAFAVGAALSGCNSSEKSSFAVTGRLVQDGKPPAVSSERLPPGTRPIQIVFYALSSDGSSIGESFHSAVNTDTGEFEVKGSANKGIPAGKYRISVAVLSAAPGGPPRGGGPPRPGSDGAVNSAGMMGMSDKLKGAFSRERSRLEIDITQPTQLVIDVGSKPGVSVP